MGRHVRKPSKSLKHRNAESSSDPAYKYEAKEKAMAAKFRLHTVLIGAPLFVMMFLNETWFHLSQIEPAYVVILYIALAIIDYLMLRLSYRG